MAFRRLPSITEEVNLDGSLKDLSTEDRFTPPPPLEERGEGEPGSLRTDNSPGTVDNIVLVRQKQIIPNTEPHSISPTAQENKSTSKPHPAIRTTNSSSKDKHSSAKNLPSDANKRWSGTSGELELAQATVGKPTKIDSSASTRRKWSIPDTDSDDDFSKRQEIWAASRASNERNVTSGRSAIGRFNLPSDSEEEDPYSTAKSPSLSIKSAAPPLPPPVSTIPKNHHPLLPKGKHLSNKLFPYQLFCFRSATGTRKQREYVQMYMSILSLM